MLVPVIFFSLVLLVVALVRGRRWWQRRNEPPMYVTPWPEIELRQPYGGWNADAYDAGTGRDRAPPPLWTVTLRPGPRSVRAAPRPR